MVQVDTVPRPTAGVCRAPVSALSFGRRPEVRQRWIDELGELVALPTVAADPGRRRAMEDAARWLRAHFRRLGLDGVTIIRGAGPPSVYGQWLRMPGAPTVLLYGHYDVQPAESRRGWSHPPFRLSIAGDRLYGRGVSDDKGQFFTHLKALECHLASAGTLPVNVKVWVEGEEEVGSPHLSHLLDHHGERFAADVVVVSDSPMADRDKPSIVYGLRGMLAFELRVRGPERDLHAGLFGGAVLNPLQALAGIVAGFHETSGRVALPGFYRDLVPVLSSERAMLARTAPTDRDVAARTGAPVWGEPGWSEHERVTLRPALTVNTLSGGYLGPGSKAVIPTLATAKIQIRLAPGQSPSLVARAVRARVQQLAPRGVRVSITFSAASPPVLLPRTHPAVGAAARCLTAAWGSAPVLTRMGGTVPPVSAFWTRYRIPVLMIGFADPDDNAHGPNEHFRIRNLHRGVETMIRLLAELGRLRSVPA